MPRIIDHPIVLARLESHALRSLYHNSGAFGFTDGVTPEIVGWIGGDDSTIRPAMRDKVTSIPAPVESHLAARLIAAWQTLLPGVMWVMPNSHWAYEIEFGNRDWLPEALRAIALDPADLQSRNNGSAIEFAVSEIEPARMWVTTLLTQLLESDFSVAFPGHPVLCMIHHHKQLWWQTTSPALAESLRQVAR